MGRKLFGTERILTPVQPEPEKPSALAEALATLGSDARLTILRQLRTPRTLREIELRAADEEPAQSPAGRPISRQGVRHHLNRLLQIGVVTTQEGSRDYGDATEYVLNHQALFALAEEFRALAKLRPVAEPVRPTVASSEVPAAGEFRSPCLVLVKGLGEGRMFDLSPAGRSAGGWVIGRRRGIHVPLDYDPFVSGENAVVTLEGGVYQVENVPESRNGTSVNFRPLPPDGRRRLETGDLIGVGRTLLMFRA